MSTFLPRFAVTGHPVSHSQSPWIHQEFARLTDRPLSYERLDLTPEAFADGIGDFFADGGVGLNVTLPHKPAACALAGAGATERARRAGAANTLWLDDEGLRADTTDGLGLLADLKRLQVAISGARILFLGAGGAVAGVLEPLLAQHPAEILILNRSVDRAKALCERFADLSQKTALAAGALTQPLSGSWDLIVQGSSAGVTGEGPFWPEAKVSAQAWAYDLSYGQAAQGWLALARQAGVQHCADGLGMLVGQAAESFLIWHGVRPPVEPVLEALRARLEAH